MGRQMAAAHSGSDWSAVSARPGRRPYHWLAPAVWQRPRVPSAAAHPHSYVVPVVHFVDDPDDRGIDGRGLATERVAGGLALDDDEHPLADAGPDRVNRNQRHASGSPFQRERLNQQQLCAFELTVLLRRNDGADDSADLHSSASSFLQSAIAIAI